MLDSVEMPQTARKTAAATRRKGTRTADRPSEKIPYASQRERLIDAMTELSAKLGYQQVSVAQLSSRAGVSSATFYEQFADKEDCLIAAYLNAARQIVSPLDLTGGGDSSAVARAAFGGLLPALRSNPAAARVLLIEARAAGPRLRAERERALEVFDADVEAALEAASGGKTLDIPAEAMVGAVRSVAVWRLQNHADDELPALVDDLMAWMNSYSTKAELGRWSVGPEAQPDAVAAPLGPVQQAPSRLPRGRHGLPPSVVRRSQRTRIIYGTAAVIASKGFPSATVSDIVSAAGVSREVFYEHFADKLDAFLEAQRYGTQELMDACAIAYFSGGTWPERIWRGLQVLLRLIVSHPTLSHLRFVESYAAGPSAFARSEDLIRSFTVFFEEGYGQSTRSRELPRLCSQAIAGAISEAIYRHVVSGQTAALTDQLPRLAYVAIAPFTGADQAVRLVRGMAAREAREKAA
jgi:AcrR family transcriptional regulator